MVCPECSLRRVLFESVHRRGRSRYGEARGGHLPRGIEKVESQRYRRWRFHRHDFPLARLEYSRDQGSNQPRDSEPRVGERGAQ